MFKEHPSLNVYLQKVKWQTVDNKTTRIEDNAVATNAPKPIFIAP